MPIFGVKSSFLELGILAVQKRELIIEEVHKNSGSAACSLKHGTIKDIFISSP